MYVLANDSSDPLSPYTMRGQIGDSTDKWAIDGTVFTYGGKLYMCWSGWEGDVNVAQNLYLAEMSDPFTICSERVLLSKPEYDWEKKGATGKPESPFINEGPCAVVRGDKLFMVYSAAGSWCNDYCLAMLRFKGGDVLDASNWEKLPQPVFSRSEKVKGPGHCSMLVKDGEMASLLIYHAFDEDCKFGWNSAHAVAQRFTWTDDITCFGEPEYNEIV
jgi:GH43 family beta-xylosidase